MSSPELSVVTTTFNSEKTILSFIESTVQSVAELEVANWELVIVDDGSSDASVDIIKQFASGGIPITLIELSRNWGQTPAIRTGLEHAKGGVIFLIDSDLEEDPFLLKAFYNDFYVHDCDMIFGRQKKRRGGVLEVWSGMLFYIIFRKLTGVRQPDNILTVRIMSRRFVESLLMYREFNLNLGAVWSIMGFSSRHMYVDKPRKWKTNYNWSKKVSLAIRAIVSYSSTPLAVLAFFGFTFAGVAFFFSIYWILSFLFAGAAAGFTTLVVSIWILGGFTALTVSTIALYVGSIFDEAKNRPHSIVKEITRF